MSYDPTIGRFLEQDPKGFAAGDPDLYRYVKNDPTDATDPTGLQGLGQQDPATMDMATLMQEIHDLQQLTLHEVLPS